MAARFIKPVFFKKIITFVGLAALVAGVLLAAWSRKAMEEVVIPNLKVELESNLNQWSVLDIPVANSQEMVAYINEVLAFDDALYRVYRNGELEVAVWIAYWSPGKVDVKDVQLHFPENCWVYSGWEIQDWSQDYIFELRDHRALVDGNYRNMVKGSMQREIVFWHKVGTDNLLFSIGSRNIKYKIREMINFIFRMPHEQYYIRISSNIPFSELSGDPDYEKIISSIAKFGLWES